MSSRRYKDYGVIYKEGGQPQEDTINVAPFWAQEERRDSISPPSKKRNSSDIWFLRKASRIEKMAVFWVAAPCRLVRVYRRFRGLYCFHHQGVDWWVGGYRVMMEAVRASETSLNSYQSTQRYNPEDGHLCTHRRENLKSQPAAMSDEAQQWQLDRTQMLLFLHTRLETAKLKGRRNCLKSISSYIFSVNVYLFYRRLHIFNQAFLTTSTFLYILMAI
jgi:hypothetical protein